MADAVGTTMSIRIGGSSVSEESVVFTTSGRTITFPGFLRAYVEETDESAEKDDAEKRLPQLTRGDGLTAHGFEADGHSTSPPSRFTEPSLVKAMEELGVGRPSTYASIMETIQNRGYAWKKGAALVPTWTAFAVIGLLEAYFGRLVDYGFTASVENDLDDIASGERSRIEWLHNFYFGSGEVEADSERISAQGGLKRLIASRLEEIDARGVNSIAIAGTDALVRVGRYGPYVQRGEGEDSERASLPEDLAPDEVTPEKIEELLAAPSGDIGLGTTADGREITARSGRYGPYVSDGEKSASLFKSMALDTITIEEAERLLTLPRTLGAIEGEEVTAQNGRYGPYIKKGTESRSIESEEQLFTVTLEDAVALLAQPKARGRRAAAAPPLKELGEDPISKKPMVVKERRTHPCALVTPSRASPTSGPPNCWPIAVRAARSRRRRRRRPPRRRRRRRPQPRRRLPRRLPRSRPLPRRPERLAESASVRHHEDSAVGQQRSVGRRRVGLA
jgi:DNA topoisomerase-1